jgi:hypothetical protein
MYALNIRNERMVAMFYRVCRIWVFQSMVRDEVPMSVMMRCWASSGIMRYTGKTCMGDATCSVRACVVRARCEAWVSVMKGVS